MLLHQRHSSATQLKCFLLVIIAFPCCAQTVIEQSCATFTLDSNGTLSRKGNLTGQCTMISLSEHNIVSVDRLAFSGMTSLLTLYLNYNSITSLPAGLFDDLTSLQALYLDSNQISALPDGIFDSLKQLTVLSLQYNQLTSVSARTFKSLSSLIQIYINNNKFSCIDGLAFENSLKLNLVSLNGNPMNCVPAVSLNVLQFNSAQQYPTCPSCLSCREGTYFKNATAASTTLYGCPACPSGMFSNIAGNVTSSCPSCPPFSTSPNGSMSLDKCQCNIGYGGVSPLSCSACSEGTYKPTVGNSLCIPQVKIIRLQCCSFSLDELGTLRQYGECASCTYLDLSRQGIKNLDANVFKGFNVERLDLTGNELAAVPYSALSSMEYVQTLVLDKNRITRLSYDGMSFPSWIYTLTLDGNGMVEIDPRVFSSMTSLQYLSLYNNSLPSLPDGLFAGTKQLLTFRASSNRIASLQKGLFDTASSLQIVELMDNKIASFGEGCFDKLYNVLMMSLQHNSISMVPPALFKNMTNLKYLYLDQNSLTCMDGSTLKDLKMHYVSMTSNPLQCEPPLKEGEVLTGSLQDRRSLLPKCPSCVSCGEGSYSDTEGILRNLTSKKMEVEQFVCSSCPAGSVSDAFVNVTDSLCTRCPAFSSSPALSSSIAMCECMDGYTKSSLEDKMQCLSEQVVLKDIKQSMQTASKVVTAAVAVIVATAVANSVGASVGGAVSSSMASSGSAGTGGGGASGAAVMSLIFQTQFVALAGGIGGRDQSDGVKALSDGLSWSNFKLFAFYSHNSSLPARRGAADCLVAHNSPYEFFSTVLMCFLVSLVVVAVRSLVVEAIKYKKRLDGKDMKETPIPFPKWELTVFVAQFQGLSLAASSAMASRCAEYQIAGSFLFLFLLGAFAFFVFISFEGVKKQTVAWKDVSFRENLQTFLVTLRNPEGKGVLGKGQSFTSSLNQLRMRGSWKVAEVREERSILHERFMDRYGVLIEGNHGRAWWFGLFGIGTKLIIGLIIGFASNGHLNSALCITVYTIELLIILLLHPQDDWFEFIKQLEASMARLGIAAVICSYTQGLLSQPSLDKSFLALSLLSLVPMLISSLVGQVASAMKLITGLLSKLSQEQAVTDQVQDLQVEDDEEEDKKKNDKEGKTKKEGGENEKEAKKGISWFSSRRKVGVEENSSENLRERRPSSSVVVVEVLCNDERRRSSIHQITLVNAVHDETP